MNKLNNSLDGRLPKPLLKISFGLIGALCIGLIGNGFIRSSGQTKSEKEGIEREAKERVASFDYASNPTHQQTLIRNDHNQAVLHLEDGKKCTVYFEHVTTKFGGVPWGAHVTDWGDCPLYSEDD